MARHVCPVVQVEDVQEQDGESPEQENMLDFTFNIFVLMHVLQISSGDESLAQVLKECRGAEKLKKMLCVLEIARGVCPFEVLMCVWVSVAVGWLSAVRLFAGGHPQEVVLEYLGGNERGSKISSLTCKAKCNGRTSQPRRAQLQSPAIFNIDGKGRDTRCSCCGSYLVTVAMVFAMYDWCRT